MYDDLAPALLVEVEGPLRIVSLNKPEQLNAMSDDLHDAVSEVWHRLATDYDAMAVILRANGRAFCSGGYLPNFVRDAADPVHRRRGIRAAERLARAMMACELPVVAAVNGPAIGLGCTLAVMSDLVVMSEDAHFADSHVNVGLVAGDGGAVTWPLLIGMLRAKEYLLLGDKIPAEEALRIGLANRVVPADELMDTARELADRLMAQPVQALRDTKRALNKHLQAAADLVLDFALAAEGESFASDDVRRIAQQFVDDRDARRAAKRDG
ncbi:MAG: enoyl-CoA hydratase/isomerase family protein [Acidimicrobiia bacterium]